jgi:hypothetical protein
MHAIPLDTVLCTVLSVPALIELVKTKAPADRALCAAVLILGVVLGFGHFVGVNLSGVALEVVGTVVGVVACVTAVKLKQPVACTLMVMSGVLIALLSLGAVAG